MPTRNELRMQDDVHRIADALERIADELTKLCEQIAQLMTPARPPAPGSLPKLPQSAFNTERGPGHRE